MSLTRLFLGGLVTVLSLGSITPALAKPAFNNGSSNGYGTSYEYPQHDRSRFDEELESEIIDVINSVRVRKGLSELRSDTRALKSARLLAREAGREGSFGSINESLSERLQNQGLDLSYREFGEARAIVDEGKVNKVARQVVSGWLKNNKFSQVLLDEELSYAGIAAFVDNDGDVTVVLDAFGAENKPAPLPRPSYPRPNYPSYPSTPSYPAPAPGCH